MWDLVWTRSPGTGISLSTSVQPCLNHYINAPYSHFSHLLLTLCSLIKLRASLDKTLPSQHEDIQGCGCTASHILNLGTRQKQAVCLKLDTFSQ